MANKLKSPSYNINDNDSIPDLAGLCIFKNLHPSEGTETNNNCHDSLD